MPKRDRRLKEEIKKYLKHRKKKNNNNKCKETNRSLKNFFSTTGVLDIFISILMVFSF
jgi:predicted PurR-regulated permease PerM